MQKKRYKKFFFVTVSFFVFFWALSIRAATGDYINFNVDKNFDASARSQITAVLIKTSPSLYFYIEKNWWDLQVPARQNEILSGLDNLSVEFGNKIYPTLTSVFGSEWKPGVDSDSRITVLFHAMKENSSGYFRSADEYIKLQVPDSNEREMLYISLSRIDDSQLKVFLAHELLHLITFNQKDKMQGIQEEIWLNEARADYASTILGYDDVYEGSNLQRRVKDFLQNPSDSLTEWQETKYDYAVVNLFMHYLVEHYSIDILADSLKSKSVGIQSLNEILLRKGIKEDFSQIFTNWTVASIINDCSLDLKYCYLNKNLKNLRVNPTLNFLPLAGNSSLSVANITKNWSANWQKIIGGNGDLKLDFSSLTGLNFQVPYIIFNKDGGYSVKLLQLDSKQKGEINIKDFDSKYTSLVIIPSLQTKISDFNGLELTYPYTFTVSMKGEILADDVLVQKLLAEIDSLKKQIAAIQNSKNQNNACLAFNDNLYFSMKNNQEVRCLQQFLKNQGQNIYPEGLMTGYFGRLTKAAVIRFQKKYGIFQTGFVGVITRTKMNQLLNAI